MLYTFKSKCCADITMLAQHAQLLLATLGKDASETGIVTAEQVTAAIQAVETAIAQAESVDDSQACTADDVQGGVWDDVSADAADMQNTNDKVSLRARYTPVLQMLKAAQQSNTHIIWEID